MSTDLYEHFNNIEMKNWDLFHHNIGLKPTSKYKYGFMTKVGARNYSIYDKSGILMCNIQTSESIIRDVFPIPSRGFILIVTMSSGHIYYFEVFNIKTGAKVATYTKTMMTGGVGYGATCDVFENGDIVILNNANGTLTILDCYGALIQEVTNMIPAASSSAHKVFVNSKRKIIAVVNASNNTTYIYNKNDIGLKVARLNVLTTGAHMKGFTQKGNLINGVTSTTSAIRIHRIDYINNVVIDSPQVSLNTTNINNVIMRSIKDKIQIQRAYATGNTRELIQFNEADLTTLVTTLPSIASISDIDDKYIYAYDTNNFKVYNRLDLSVAITIPSTYDSKGMWSTKGKYENFGKYW